MACKTCEETRRIARQILRYIMPKKKPEAPLFPGREPGELHPHAPKKAKKKVKK